METHHFFILGAAKCGTTSFRYYLNQHPDICMSKPKESCFFEVDNHYEKGKDFYWEEFFSHRSSESLLGDARHRNLFYPWVPPRINKMFPEANYFILLRNPVTRAYSHYWQWVQYEKEDLSFEEAIYRNFERLRNDYEFSAEDHGKCQEWFDKNRVPDRSYLDTGYYKKQIERFLECVDESQIKIFLFENFVDKTEMIMNDAFEFLDLSTPDQLNLSRKNTGVVPRFQKLHSILFELGDTKISEYVPQALKDIVLDLNLKDKTQEPMNPLTELWLYQHYRERNKQLEDFLSRDLSHWAHPVFDDF